MFEYITGASMDTFFNNPHLRWHKTYEEYGSHLSDIDDYDFNRFDEFERFKKFKPLEKNVVGDSPIIPREDTDEKLEWFDIQGESLYSNPPNPNFPLVDHGLDEEFIWGFQRTFYN